MKTNLMYDSSNLPMKGNSSREINTIKNVKIANSSHCISDADIIKTISEILTNDYTLQQKPYIKQIERTTNRNVIPLLSTKFKVELYEVAENMASIYLGHSFPSTILANVAIEYITDVRVDVTIYLTDASSATIYTDKFSGDMLLVSEDSHQNTYLENDLTAFDYTDIQSALRSMIEYQFFKHQQIEIKKDAKKRNITDPFVWIDNDFNYPLSAVAIDMECNMDLEFDDRIKLKIDYFREKWTHIKVTVTLYNTRCDWATLKISGDVGVWGFID
ncbi:MAG: hypothetical protein SNG04_05895 [Rikenellaceae bacterium]